MVFYFLFHVLSINSESYKTARWLAAPGIICFVLKYRLIESKTTDPTTGLAAKNSKQTETDVALTIKLAVTDGLAAVGYTRQHVADYGLNPKRIGGIGFSVGGTVAASVMYNYTPQTRHNFGGPIYLKYECVLKREVPAVPNFIYAQMEVAVRNA